MRNELLQASEIVGQNRPCFKIVQLKFTNLMFQLNAHADQPIFKKQSFKYDKYELAKIISFDQFQLLFRPFKNEPLFKRNIICDKITNAFLILLVLVPIAQFIFVSPDVSDNAILIWFISFVALFILFLLLLFCSERVRSKLQNKLVEYCIDISQQQSDVQINLIETKESGFAKYLVQSQKYFEVKSRTIQQDHSIIKLYNHQGFNLWSSSLDKPIFTQKSYSYDKKRLQNIITFQEFQLLFRPFKSNETYRKTVFWGRLLILVMPSILLCLVPLLFVEQGSQDKYLLTVCFVYAILVYLSLILISFRLQQLNSKLVIDFIGFCQQISIQNQKISVTVHLQQINKSSCLQPKNIYRIQVRSKQV